VFGLSALTALLSRSKIENIKKGSPMNMKERSERRRKIINVHCAGSFADANRWDLEFWQIT